MDIRVTTTTSAPPERVWQLLADLDGWPRWLPTVDRLEPVTPGAEPGLGAAYLVKQPRLPLARWTVTDWNPGRAFTWRSTAPGVVTTATHEIIALPEGGSEVVLAITWTGPLAPMARRAMGALSQRYVEREAAALSAEVDS